MFPSVYDNAPLVVREAAACGCASLLIKGSNSAEGIEDGENGILTEEKVSDIALGINDALSKYDLEEMGRQARDTIYISWDDVLVKVTDEYQRIIDNWNSTKHKKHKKTSLEEIDLLKDFNLTKKKKKMRK